MQGLLFTSFGTSHEDTRVKTLDAIEAALRQEFPDLPLYTAWTSNRIIAKVKAERKEHHDSLDQAFKRLSADGIDDLVVATTCLMQGNEMGKIAKAAETWAVGETRTMQLAQPLLASKDDCRAVAQALSDEFADVSDCEAVLLMGHGSEFGGNDAFGKVQAQLRDLERTNFFVATVEGTLTFDDVAPLMEERGATRVFLAPLMIVAGDHAKNDLTGPGEDSWASRLHARGIATEARLKGLGEYERIRKLVCDHVHDALLVREVALRG